MRINGLAVVGALLLTFGACLVVFVSLPVLQQPPRHGGDDAASTQSNLAAPRLMPDVVPEPKPLTACPEPVVVDPSLRPVSHISLPITTVPTLIGQLAVPPELLSVSGTVSGQPLVWPIVQSNQVIRVGLTDFTLTFSAPNVTAIEVTTTAGSPGGRQFLQPGGALAANRPTTPLNPAGALPVHVPQPGRYEFEARATQPAVGPARNVPLTVIVPSPGSPAAPAVSKAFNNPFAGDIAVQNQELSASPAILRVYGTFLRLEGSIGDTTRLGELRWALFDQGNNNRRWGDDLTASPDRVPSNGLWLVDLTLPSNLPRGFRGLLLAYSLDHNGNHQYSPAPVTFLVAEDRVVADPPQITDVSNAKADADKPSPLGNAKLVTQKTFDVSGTTTLPTGFARTDSRLVLYQTRGGLRTRILDANNRAFAIDNSGNWSVPVTVTTDGDYVYDAEIVQGSLVSGHSAPQAVHVRSDGPSIVDVEPRNKLFEPGRIKIRFIFDPQYPLNKGKAEIKSNYTITPPGDTARDAADAQYDKATNSVTVVFADFGKEGEYTVIVESSNSTNTLVDIFGQALDADYTEKLQQSSLIETPTVERGISRSTGPNTEFPEYTNPRPRTKGFNPGDHVETRVARLYYYRDAHRVAQIINRDVQSYNRQGVDVAQQLADRARREADGARDQRQQAENTAIVAAQRAREAEKQLERTQQQVAQAGQDAANNFNRADQLETRLENDAAFKTEFGDRASKEIAERREQAGQAQQVADALAASLAAKSAVVEQARSAEVQANDKLLVSQQEEDRLRKSQFEREVAAAHADPDTYAPGKLSSIDPVRQVSVSVIGEGLIQLRGPIKGINTIRRMINQIDSPVGQVKIQVHSLQFNGEHGDRMEKVAADMQRYIDQSRFLTMQSAETLRKAVEIVAAQKADEARALYPGESQEERDQRYLYSFFGKDFVDELRAMDSEFLMTGNKLLSLHSMDTTSLASAVAKLALANNSTRQQILQQFEQMLHSELPRAELSYLEAGLMPEKSKFQWPHQKTKLYPMADRAHFESLRGFFNVELGHDDTMTPAQREVIRLAQIMKSQLVTEMEFNQRVMERALIEDRLGDMEEQASAAVALENAVRLELQGARQDMAGKRGEVLTALSQLETRMYAPYQALIEAIRSLQEPLARMDQGNAKEQFNRQNAIRSTVGSLWKDQLRKYKYRGEYLNAYLSLRRIATAKNTEESEKKRDLTEPELAALLGTLQNDLKNAGRNMLTLEEGFRIRINEFVKGADALLDSLARPDADISTVYKEWGRLRNSLDDIFWLGRNDLDNFDGLKEELKLVQDMDDRFRSLLELQFRIVAAREKAEIVRRPLDHKKLLDMLIDEIEDKYIELLEGSRAHTANIDAYIKRLATAIDDDFNTQFYFPAMKQARDASRYWDVTFSQLETTSILANNRAFGKVSPEATMEFDLPKRDILINEAMDVAKASIDEFGALVNDPAFLSLAQLNSGGSTASMASGVGTNFSRVRSVLPGLDSSTQEQFLNQTGPGQSQFGAAFENLIPPPSIYKFETGTGYEVRPVIQPDGQAVVFHFNYMYTTNIREPVKADEKHLGRVKRHFIDTDVQLSNFELREVSRYQVALKASRTSQGVPLAQDIPIVGALFRPLPSDESSLQQNLILAQATIFPTLFDLMGMRWAPAVADLDPLRTSNAEFVVRGRRRDLMNRVFDYSSTSVDDFLRIPQSERRSDLYRTQESIPRLHPNGYVGPGMDLRDSTLQEGYQPERAYPQERYIPSESNEGSPLLPGREGIPRGVHIDDYPLQENAPEPEPIPLSEPRSSIRQPILKWQRR